jgi:hypothetical protein
MKKQTVHQLRKNGWKVKVGHKRIVYRFDPKTGVKNTKTCLIKNWKEEYPTYYLSAKGGITEVSITSPQGVTHTEVSICNEKDHYDGRIGVDIALGRVLAKF